MSKKIKKWIQFLAGILVIWVFIYILSPFVVDHSSHFSQMAEFIDSHDCNTGAFAYTDSELAGEAMITSLNTTHFYPDGIHPK